MNISDDILVYGNCKTTHDENLKAVLTRLEDKGLTLNYNKLKRWFSPDPAKISAIKKLSAPNNMMKMKLEVY